MKRLTITLAIIVVSLTAKSQTVRFKVVPYATKDSVDEILTRYVGAEGDNAFYYIEERYKGEIVRPPKNVVVPTQAVSIMVERPINIPAAQIIFDNWNIELIEVKED